MKNASPKPNPPTQQDGSWKPIIAALFALVASGNTQHLFLRIDNHVVFNTPTSFGISFLIGIVVAGIVTISIKHELSLKQFTTLALCSALGAILAIGASLLPR
jgi:hypothetical protein